MKTLYRGAEAGIIILNAAVAAADGAVARANDLINNSPLNSFVNGVLRPSCGSRADTNHVSMARLCLEGSEHVCTAAYTAQHPFPVPHARQSSDAPPTGLRADNTGPNATANGTDSTTRLMAQLAEGASAAADVAAALPPSTRATASSLVQSAVKLASSFSPSATGGRQQVGGLQGGPLPLFTSC